MKEIFGRFHVENANTVAVPAGQHQDLSLSTDRESRVDMPYKEAVRNLLYLAIVIRSDLIYAVNSVSQYTGSPKKIHYSAIKRIL